MPRQSTCDQKHHADGFSIRPYVATSLADHRARVRAGRNRWSTGQHFCPAQAMCGLAALVHSTTDLLGNQTCNRVIHIQPRGWIAAPCRTELSSTHLSDNELRKSSTLTEFLQRTITCWPGKTPRSRSGLRRWSRPSTCRTFGNVNGNPRPRPRYICLSVCSIVRPSTVRPSVRPSKSI